MERRADRMRVANVDVNKQAFLSSCSKCPLTTRAHSLTTVKQLRDSSYTRVDYGYEYQWAIAATTITLYWPTFFTQVVTLSDNIF